MIHTLNGIKNIRKPAPILPVAVYSNDIPPKPPQPCHNTSMKIPASKRVRIANNKKIATIRFF
jgi:hypothetical protein